MSLSAVLLLGHGEPVWQVGGTLIRPGKITRRDLDRGNDDHVSYRVHRGLAGHDPAEGLAVHGRCRLVAEQRPRITLYSARPDPHLPQIINRDCGPSATYVDLSLYASDIVARGRT